MAVSFFYLEKRGERFAPVKEGFGPLVVVEGIPEDKLYEFALAKLAAEQVLQTNGNNHAITQEEKKLKWELVVNLLDYKGFIAPTVNKNVKAEIMLRDYWTE